MLVLSIAPITLRLRRLGRHVHSDVGRLILFNGIKNGGQLLAICVGHLLNVALMFLCTELRLLQTIA